ncbi:helix-turn-helix transcriptional regulator [Streptomonospora alba]|nr:LuxR family transcriptional regulator [Streptomonospora alba]
MDLLERDREISHIKSALSGAFAGKPTFTVVNGGVGSGKTELLHYAAELAASAGVPHLPATNSPQHGAAPFEVVRQLINQPALGERVASSAMRRLTDALEEAADSETHGHPHSQHQITLRKELSSVLADAVRGTPLLLTVDDVHHADSASLGVLQEVVESWNGGGLILLLSQSLHGAPADPLFHVETLRSRIYSRFRLHPLSQEGIRRLLSTHLCESATEQLAAEYTYATGGNPLLLRSLIEDARNTEPAPAALAAGREYQQSVLACLRRCSPPVVEGAQAAAVLATSRRLRAATPLLLGYVFEDGPRTAEHPLNVLQEIGILDPEGRFRLNAARTAILSDLPPERYRELRVRALHAMHLRVGQNRRGEDLPNILGTGTSGTWTAALLLDAAETDLAQDEMSSALAHLQLAMDSCPDEASRCKTVAGIARTKWRIDPLTAAQHFDFLLEAAGKDALAVRETVTLMHQLAWHGQTAKIAELIEHFSTDGTPSQPPELHSACQLLLNTLPTLKPFLDRVAPALGEQQPGTTFISVRARAGGSLAQLLEGGPRDEAVTTAQQILRTSPLTDFTLEALECALLILISCGRFEAARSACDTLLDEATRREVPTWRALLAAYRAEIALREGDLAAAAQLARDALAVLPPTSWGAAIGAPLGVLVHSTTLLGDLDEAAAHLQYEVPEAMYRSRYCLGYLMARGQHHLATGDARLARADFEFCGALMKEWQLERPGFVAWRSAAAESLIRMGEPQQARDLLDEQLSLTEEDDQRVRGITLQLLARTRPASRPALLEEAVDLLRASGDTFSLSLAMQDLSDALRSLGDTRRARLLADRAHALGVQARDAGTPGTSSAEEVPAADDEDCPAGASPLTKSERRVAELAAQGLTNREISNRCFITISTVEQHLTNVYRKLNVKTRLALPDGLADQADTS